MGQSYETGGGVRKYYWTNGSKLPPNDWLQTADDNPHPANGGWANARPEVVLPIHLPSPSLPHVFSQY